MIAWFAGAFPSGVGALRDQRGEPCGSSETPEARARIHREGAEVGQAAGGGGSCRCRGCRVGVGVHQMRRGGHHCPGPWCSVLGVLLEVHVLIIESSRRQHLSNWRGRLSFGMASALARSRLRHFPFCSVFQEQTEDST